MPGEVRQSASQIGFNFYLCRSKLKAMSFVEELRWRDMIQDVVPGTEDELAKGMRIGYVGFDPTADSLHIGNMVPIMLLTHFQRAGHKPLALVGGATGMVGDPSGKSSERNLLDIEAIRYNEACIRKQLEKFLDFDCGANSAEIVNNFDWFKDISFLDFIRDTGKHITVNYMMSKDSVKNRIGRGSEAEGADIQGMSFTEFTYQLIQGYDFYHLWKEKDCILQMGGSDQWGNITTGTELIRRKDGGEAYALTARLLLKSDGTKFGKSESGNVWLDRNKTSPYQLYQFWVNTPDEQAESAYKIFSLRTQEEVEGLIAEHREDPGRRLLQQALAEEFVTRVHSEEDRDRAVAASHVLFGKGTKEQLMKLSDAEFQDVFGGVPQAEISRDAFSGGMGMIDLLAGKTGFLASNSEARRALKENSVSVNLEKVTEDATVGPDDLLNGKYLLVQRGKRKKFLVTVGE